MADTKDVTPAVVTDAPVKKSRGRTVTVVILLVLAGLFSFLAVPIVFIHGEVLNTDRYVASVAPLNYNPEVANALSTQLTNQLFQRYDVEKLVNESLPGPLSYIAKPFTNQLHGYVQKVVTKLIMTKQFHFVWVSANRVAHRQMVTVLTGNGSNISADKSGTVTLNLQNALTEIRQQLVADGASIFAKIPVGLVPSRVVLVHSKSLGQIRFAVKLLKAATVLLIVLALACFAGAIALSRRRRRTLFQAGLTLSFTMAILAVVVALARTIAIDSIAGTSTSTGAVGVVYDTILSRLHFEIRALFVIGLIVAIVAWLMGSSRPSVATRAALAGLGPMIKRGWVAVSPAFVWVVARRRPFEFVVGAAGLFYMVFWAGPLAGLIVAIVCVALIVALELAGRRSADQPALERPDATPALESNDSSVTS